MSLRENAVKVVERLQAAGHEAVVAGGCVRDRLLGIEPADYDIATSALPDQVEALFDKTIAVGKQFGILIVPVEDHNYEVATFRQDGPYFDGRRPDTVAFSDAKTDANRRDFTINAMFEDPVSGETIDYVGGRADLEAGLVRAVGDPTARFGEDRLRLIRAVRFAARFDFRIDDATREALVRDAAALSQVSAERLGDEFRRILVGGAARRGFELMDETGLLAVVLPELLEAKDCEQTPDHHPEGDVFVHTLACIEQLVAGCSATLALGTLLHDIAKPRTAETREDGRRTFYGHCELGAEMAAEICARLRYSNEITEGVQFLVAQHLRHCAARDMRRSTLKKFLRQDGIDELLELARIDAIASSKDLSHYEFCKEQLETLPEEVMRPPRLLTGNDLQELGLEPGPLIKEILGAVEDAQLEGEISDRDGALALVRRRFLDS
jgi:poly(A) polymerase